MVIAEHSSRGLTSQSCEPQPHFPAAPAFVGKSLTFFRVFVKKIKQERFLANRQVVSAGSSPLFLNLTQNNAHRIKPPIPGVFITDNRSCVTFEYPFSIEVVWTASHAARRAIRKSGKGNSSVEAKGGKPAGTRGEFLLILHSLQEMLSSTSPLSRY